MQEQRAGVPEPEIASVSVSQNMLLDVLVVVVIVIDRTLQLNSEMSSLFCLSYIITVSIVKRSTRLSHLI